MPFGVGYIDHIELDVELVGSRIKVNLGRPWATFLSDGLGSLRIIIFD
jgi:putative transposase